MTDQQIYIFVLLSTILVSFSYRSHHGNGKVASKHHVKEQLTSVVIHEISASKQPIMNDDDEDVVIQGKQLNNLRLTIDNRERVPFF